MAHTNKKIDAQIRSILKTMDGIEDSGVKALIQKLEKLRHVIVQTIVETGELDANTSGRLKREIVEVMEQYRPGIEELLTSNQRRLFIKGIQMIDTVAKSADLTIAIPYLSEQVLDQVKEYSSDLVTGLTDYARRQITTQIDLAVLGQKPVNDVIKAIGQNLSDPSVFGTTAKRAEAIFRTEVNRIANISSVRRMNQVQNQIPDLAKEWLHSHIGIPRPGHLRLDGTVVALSEKFDLVAADGTPYKVAGPHDPILPVGEVVNCRCHVIPSVGRFRKAA